MKRGIELYSDKEIEKIEKACKVVAEVLHAVAENVKPGITAWDIEMIAREEAKKRGAKPAFLNYKPPFSNVSYPAATCVSINEEVVHGLPKKERVIEEGDLVSVDFGAIIDGYAGDSAITVAVGNVDADKKRLMEATKLALERAVQKAAPGNWLSDIVEAVHSTAEEYGVYPVLRYGGHGIGKKVHEEPFIPNNRKDLGKKNVKLRRGMVIAIEPMFALGTEETVHDGDGWTVKTKDGSPSAHFEHTVAITKEGPKVLTEI
ncbi:methionyl aminopeptidase [Hydrogenivirga caldilitoris]|uniref:Methionine aminopeptidase n=1 Tax=Hydrogenivirga caldilitoris TaxID=246264 RepID=A0A497XLR3_9AQUI|nr:type I methionyl aminopeptidase [Hydrogenivirga caldilitoris]RLJ69817.1 methionyl aminopeptidase [Hydrogenivirga caldilitoris]